jgi:hypothetical protein
MPVKAMRTVTCIQKERAWETADDAALCPLEKACAIPFSSLAPPQ